jgi:outer membrane lipase/esterase
MRRFALAGALALLGNAAHAQYTNLYVFGDSLSDSGAFTSLVTALGAPTANKFTNNPGTIWSENLGARYGIAVTPGFSLDLATTLFTATGGNNYAIGGARITQVPGVFSLPPNPPLGDAIAANILPIATQVTTNLAQTGGTASPGALYAFWGGANDVFFQAGAVGLGLPVATASANVVSAATDAVTQINRLRAAGAGTLVVIAVPDIGVTPFAAASPPGTAQLLTGLSGAYNTALQEGLVASGATNLVYLDPRPLIADAIARPAAYGITNTTVPACGAASSLGCGPAQQIPGSSTFLFADGVHPTTLVHQILSDWTASTLSAPSQLSALARIPLGRLGAQWRAVDNRVRDFTTSSGTRGFFVTGDYAPTRIEATGTSSALKGDGKMVNLGIDAAFGQGLLGVSAGFSEHSYDLGGAGGQIDYSEVAVSGYGAWRFGDAYLDATLSYSAMDYDVRRNVALGPLTATNSGTTSGHQTGARIGGGYNFTAGSLVHGPLAAISWERVSVDGFSEAASPTAMTFGDQKAKSLRHRIGWQLVGDWPTDWARLRPYARLTHEKEYEDNAGTVTAGFVGSPFTFSTATPSGKDTWGLLAAGVNFERKDFNIHAGFSSTFGRNGVRDDAVFLGVSIPLQ